MDEFDSDSQYRTLSPDQILSWGEDDAQIMRLRTDRDVILGGIWRQRSRYWLTGWPAIPTVTRLLSFCGTSTTAGTRLKNPPYCDRLSSEGVKHVYLDGGATIHGYLAEGLVDEITITWIPVLIGVGRPLFGPLMNDVALELIDSHSYDFGFVQSRYSVRRQR